MSFPRKRIGVNLTGKCLYPLIPQPLLPVGEGEQIRFREVPLPTGEGFRVRGGEKYKFI